MNLSESKRSKSSPSASHAWNLLLLSTLGAADGTIVVLAATGALGSWNAAVIVGLTVIAGAGAWLVARQAFAGRMQSWRSYAVLLAMALVSTLAVVAAAWLGQAVGQAVRLHVLPKAAGVALCLIGAQVAGIRLPQPGRLPLPALALAAGLLLEVGWQWIP